MPFGPSVAQVKTVAIEEVTDFDMVHGLWSNVAKAEVFDPVKVYQKVFR